MVKKPALRGRAREPEVREAKGRHGECRAEEAEMCQEVRAEEGGESTLVVNPLTCCVVQKSADYCPLVVVTLRPVPAWLQQSSLLLWARHGV